MKIENSVQPITGVATNDGHKRIDKTNNAVPNPGTTQDNVHLSSLSKQPHVDSNAVSSGVIDTSRVQEIKQAISDGNFKVNPEAVADRLLETARELIQTKKGDL
ncbi:MAG: flagellar biosynthesis anti-sigma factor FlgM [Nitrosomonas sp.]|nr:flagellar biosynthesis anti-sigma factor FlgM [Nitrosomonas sp.]